mgnify:CR=1 FL=1
MPQQQINIPLPSPGFGGLNTEDSPLTSDPSFCSVANNCTIDKLGRLSSRRGFKYLTANPNILQDVAGVAQPIAVMGEFIKEDTGVSTLFACGNNKIFIQQTVTPFEVILIVSTQRLDVFGLLVLVKILLQFPGLVS